MRTLRLGGDEQWWQFVLVDEVGGKEVGANQEHRDMRRIESGADFLLPVIAGPDVGIVPAVQATSRPTASGAASAVPATPCPRGCS